MYIEHSGPYDLIWVEVNVINTPMYILYLYVICKLRTFIYIPNVWPAYQKCLDRNRLIATRCMYHLYLYIWHIHIDNDDYRYLL